MTFPRRLLNEGEEIAIELRPHWWFFAGPASSGVFIVALAFLVTKLDGDARDTAWLVWAVVTVLWALWLLVRFLRWITTEFVVSTDRLIFRAGVLRRHGREVPLERINDITFEKSLWERIVGAGDLLIESAGEMGQQRFTDIPHPDFVQQEIYRQIEANERRTAGYAREPTVPEQIAQLADLRERGVLSEEEFQEQKRRLLDRM